MRVSTYKVLAGAALAVMTVASGCHCYHSPPQTTLAIEFQQPTDGATLTPNDDLDAAADGLQYDIVAQVMEKDVSGESIKHLENARVESAKLFLTANGETREGPAVQIDGYVLKVPGVALAIGENHLKLEVSESGTTRSASAEIVVKVIGTPAIAIAYPTAGAIVTAKDDADSTAGFQLGFKVNAPGLEGAQGTLFCENVCGVTPTNFTVGSGDVTEVKVTLAQTACELTNATCHAVVKTRAGQTVQSAPQTFQLDTDAPRIEIAEPTGPVKAQTFRVAATVDCAESGQPAVLSRAGAPPLTANVSNGAVVFPAVNVPADGVWDFTLTVTDKGGNTTSRPLQVVVGSVAPTLEVSIPSTITTDDNGDPNDGVQATLTAKVNSEPEGTDVSLWPSVTGSLGARELARTVQVGADRIATFEVNLAEGPNSLRVCVSNVAGVETCESRTVTVSTGRAQCRIIHPAYHEVRKPESGMTNVKLDAVSGPIALTVIDANGASVAAAVGSASAGTATVPVALPSAEGDYFLIAKCGGSGVSQKLPFTIDGSAPTLSIAVAGKQGDEIQLGPDTADTGIEPGVQTVVDVTTEPRSLVTASFSGCDSNSSAVGTAGLDGKVSLRGFTLPMSGQCTLNVTAVDRAGNSTQTSRMVKSALQPGGVAFMGPANGSVLGAKDGTPGANGGLTVPQVLVSVVGVNGHGTVKLFRGQTEIGAQSVTATTSQISFANVQLEEGANVLRLVLSEEAGGTSCAVALVTVNTAPAPTIALTNPATSSTFNLGIDFGPDEPGIQRPLSYLPAVTQAVDICSDVKVGASATACRGDASMFMLLKDAQPNTQGFTFPDGKYAIRAVLADGSAKSEAVNLTVDSTRPVVKSVSFQNDNGDNVLSGTELPPGQKVAALVVVEGVEDGQTVQVLDKVTGTVYGTGAVSNGAAMVTLTNLPAVGEAKYDLVVKVTDAAGNPNNISQSKPFDPRNDAAFVHLEVDQVAPTIAVTSPTKSVLGPGDDANGTTGGFQLRVVVAVPADTVEVHIDRTAPMSTLSGALVPQNLSAAFDFDVTSSSSDAHVFNITARDAAGNLAAVSYSATVDLLPPTVTIAAPTNGASFTSSLIPVTVNVPGENSGSAIIKTQIGGSQYTLDTIPIVNGVASKQVYFPNGVQDVTAEVTDAAGNTGVNQPPVTITVASPGCTILISQPSSASVIYGRSADADSNFTNGLQTSILGSTPDCKGLTVSLKEGANTVATATADASTGAFGFNVTLNDGATRSFSVEMTDAFAQTSSVPRTIKADLTPPTISGLSPSGGTLFLVASTNEHLFPTPQAGYIVDKSPGGNAEFDVSFTAAGALGGQARVKYQGNTIQTIPVDADPKPISLVNFSLPHNTTGQFVVEVEDAAGNVTSASPSMLTIDVQPPAAPTVSRMLSDTRKASVDVTWTAVGDDGTTGTAAGYDVRWTTDLVVPGGITQDSQYFDATKLARASTSLLSGSSKQLTGLPPLNTYYVYARAVDEVGNYSPLVASAASVANLGSPVTLTNPGSGSNFGFAVANAGDLNGLGKADLVVGAPGSAPGYVYVYYGENGLGTGTPQTLTGPGTTADWFGISIAGANFGDSANEGRPDLLVGAPFWSASRGRAFLYFGQTGMQVDPTPIEFRGNPGSAGQFGSTVFAAPDMNNDGQSEIVISAPFETGGGVVYVFFSRSRSAWLSAQTAVESGVSFVPASAADRTFVAGTGVLRLGYMNGYSSLGDIDGDGKGDFTIPAPRESVNKVYAYSGATVFSKSNIVSEADALQTLSDEPVSASTSSFGFGDSAVGGLNLIAGTSTDLAIGYPNKAKVLIFSDGASAGFSSSPSLTITSPSARRFGYAMSALDFNGDAKPDLAVGENAAPGGSVFLFFNRGLLGAEFDGQAGSGLAQSKLTGNSLGVSLASGDWNGDGKLDLAAGDNQANAVMVWQ